MKTNKSVWTYILFFGAIWGILEATLGYVLQFLPPLVSGSVMFPIAAMLMILSYQNTKSKSAMIYVAAIAATIKAVNFFLPGLPPIKTYNPMIAIMLQSLVMVVFIPLIEKKPILVKALGIAIVGLSWRTLFLANISINYALTGFNFPQLASTASMLNLVVYLGLMEAFVLGAFYSLQFVLKNKVKFTFRPNLILSVSTFVVAVLLTFFL